MQAPGDLTHEKRKKEKKTENTVIEVGEDCYKLLQKKFTHSGKGQKILGDIPPRK